jgi:hypothetical protein
LRFRWPGARRPHSPTPPNLAVLTAVAAAAAIAVAAPLPALAVPAVPGAPARPAAGRPAPVTLGQALAQARHTNKTVQVASATTVSSTLAANPDGTLTVTETNMPVRKRVNGKWASLDATLHRNADGSVSPAVTSSSLRLSGGGAGPFATTTTLGHALSMSFPARLPAPALSGPTATYANALPGVDLVVTADSQGGFKDTLVVRNAAAARNPALRSLAFRTSVTGGLSLRTDANGILSAVSRGGRVMYQEPAPAMWDSRAAAASIPSKVQAATGRRVDQRTGQPLASGITSAGEAARVARVGLRASAGTLTYTPDQALLSGKSTVYPVYIDPVTDGAPLSYWAEVNTIPATDIKPSEFQVGYNGWQSPLFTARTFVTMNTPTEIFGSTTRISSASLFMTETDGPTCDASAGDTGVQVWRTGTVSASAVPSWSAQPSWIALEQTRSFVHGHDSTLCPAKSEGFNVAEAANWAAGGSHPTMTFGIKGDDESDKYSWKEFGSTVTMSITFDKPPFVSSQSTSPGTTCAGGDTAGKGDMMLNATVKSPLGTKAGPLSATFHVTDTTKGTTVSGLKTFTGLTSGAPVSQRLTETTLNGLVGGQVNAFSWYVTVTDGTLSATSRTCSFSYDPTTPGAPSVDYGANGWTTDSNGNVSATIGTTVDLTVTPPDGATVSGYDYQLNGAAGKFAPGTGAITLHLIPLARTNVVAVTAISAGGNVGGTFPFIFDAVAPANRADGDLTGGGAPDLVTAGGGTTGLPPGLWLSTQEQAPGQPNGDGTLHGSMTDVGQFGNGFVGDNSPSDFTGAQVISGLFSDNGLQDTLVYYPTGSYAGEGVILDSNGDGAPDQNKDDYAPNPDDPADSALTTEIKKDEFIDNDPNQYGDSPLQVANGYNADPGDDSFFPDLITVNGDSANGYYLEYYQNGHADGKYSQGLPMPDATPDRTMDWNNWMITSMAEPATTANPNGVVDLFLYKPSSGALYLWQNYQVTSDDPYNATDSYTSYQLAASGWQPVAVGSSVTELRAADITGSGPALWAVSNLGSVTPWTVSRLSANGTATIIPGTSQSLLSPSHAWRLGDDTTNSSGAITAADTGGVTALPFTGGGGATWSDQSDLFKPSVQFDGSTGYLATTSYAVVPADGFTVSAWVKPSVLGGVVLAQTAVHTSCMDINIDTTTIGGTTYGRWNFRMSNADSSSRTWATATAGDTYYVKLGAWTHLTAVYDHADNYMRLYVNGIPAAAAAPPATWGGGCNTFALGRYWDQDAFHGYFKGKIADVQAWRGVVMTPAEVASISGTPGYVLFPGGTYASAATATTWQWQTACGNMNFYQGKITIKQTCTQSGTFTFGPGGCATSPTLNFQLSDGNLVIRCNGTATWASGTSGNPGDVMFFQPDGNLVIYNTYGLTLWASGSQNAPMDS